MAGSGALGVPRAKAPYEPGLLGLSGCAGAYAEFAPTRNHVRRDALPAEAVAIYFRDPVCPFTEIGIIEAHDGTFAASPLEDKMLAMRKRAGQNGANGVLVIDHQDSRGGGHNASTDHHYSGLAIVVDECGPIASGRPAAPGSPQVPPSRADLAR